MLFANRKEAGRRLAEKLAPYGAGEPVVLGLPRGGVPVAYEVARRLRAPLDVLVVRKLGAPGRPELALGAVGPGALVLDHQTIRMLRVQPAYLERVVEQERREVARCLRQFRGDAADLDLRGRKVILVDDGIATGATAVAAVDAARSMGAARVVVAAPVASLQAAARLRARADEAVFVETPAEFGAVGLFYDDFSQLSDQEVHSLLHRARRQGADRDTPAEVS